MNTRSTISARGHFKAVLSNSDALANFLEVVGRMIAKAEAEGNNIRI